MLELNIMVWQLRSSLQEADRSARCTYCLRFYPPYRRARMQAGCRCRPMPACAALSAFCRCGPSRWQSSKRLCNWSPARPVLSDGMARSSAVSGAQARVCVYSGKGAGSRSVLSAIESLQGALRGGIVVCSCATPAERRGASDLPAASSRPKSWSQAF